MTARNTTRGGTQFELDVLQHASRTGRYVTDDPRVIAMAAAGLLNDYGPQALADGAHYLTMAAKGREALNWFERNYCRFPQPKPKRNPSPAFVKWRDYRDANLPPDLLQGLPSRYLAHLRI